MDDYEKRARRYYDRKVARAEETIIYVIGLIALFAAWLLSSIILLSATGLKRFLGKRGLIAMERLMGMLLIALAVQMLLEGISAYLAGIP